MSYGQTYANDLFAIDAAASDRAAFLRRTYLHLFGAILAFMGLEAIIFNVLDVNRIFAGMARGGSFGMIAILIGFMAASWVARSWASNAASPAMQYLGLGLYTVAEAIFFVPILWIATQIDRGGGNVIATAGIITLLTFGGLTTIVLVSGADFSFLRVGLMIGGWAALVIAIVAAFAGFSLGLLFSAAMVVLACGFILYDTSNVLHHYRTDQHVGAALELFASVALLFWYVLRIVIAFSNNND
jgi:FtsH-binding integral membrane protein